MLRTRVQPVHLKPSPHRRLDDLLHQLTDLWNGALEERIGAYRRAGETISYYDQCKSLTIIRGEDESFRRFSVHAQRSALHRLDRAFKAFFRRVALSTGASHPGVRVDRRRIRRMQKLLSRARKGSKARTKKRRRLAKTHERVQMAERHALHRLTTAIVRQHHRIAVEDLRIPNLVRNRHLARRIHAQQWGRLVQQLTYKTAWFMLHRIRKGFTDTGEPMDGPVEVDETCIGGKRKNMSNAQRRELRKEGAGRGAVGKAAVVGVKDRNSRQIRAKVVDATDRDTLHGFIRERVSDGAKVYTDEAAAYSGLPFDHETVKHSVGEYVRDQAHTNSIESFWSMLKRGHVGTYHKMSAKHLHRYVTTCAARHGMRQLHTMDQLHEVVASLAGKRLLYRDLVS